MSKYQAGDRVSVPTNNGRRMVVTVLEADWLGTAGLLKAQTPSGSIVSVSARVASPEET